MPLTPGAHLGSFEIVAPLGAGTMGEVYRAHDPRLGRDVALKVLPAEYSQDRERLGRFEQEARAAAALSHPNILAVYDVGQANGAPYIVSELLDGETLRERLAAGPLPLRTALEIGTQLAQGLAAAHDKKLVHRDLKPENIVITTGGIVKILDFGLAKLVEPAGVGHLGSAAPTTPPATTPGAVLGTLGYMSPEQLRGLPTDHRSDIFSFGAILYEMLAGRRAFLRETGADTMAAVLHEHPAEDALAQTHTPAAVIRIVERCLEKLPDRRFQSTVDLSFALHGIAAADHLPPFTRASRTRVGYGTWAVAIVLGVLALAAAIRIAGRLRRPAIIGPVVKLTVSPPPGVVQVDGTTMRVSPDGTRLVFSAVGSDGVRRLWVRPLNALDASVVSDTEGATQPFWAPDQRALGFFAGGQLKKVDLAGGTAMAICAAPQAAGATWNQEDVIVFSSGGELQRVSAAGGPAQLLPGVNGKREGATLAYPSFLPDGRHLLYLDTGSGGVGEAAVYAAAIDTPARTMVLPAATSNAWYSRGYLFYLRDDRLMAQSFDAERMSLGGKAVPVIDQIERTAIGAPSGAFSVSEQLLAYRTGVGARGFPTALTWFDRGGTVLGTVGERADYADVELSPDSRQAIVSELDPGTGRDLWVFDLARDIPTRLTSDPSDDYPGVWSPDGAHVVFGSRRKGHFDLYQKPASGGTDREIFVDTIDKWPMSWAPDGKWLLFTMGAISVAGTVPHVWGVPLEGPAKPFPLLNDPQFRQFPAKLSPDGRWIVYVSNESGDNEIYVTPYPGLNGKWRISKNGGGWPRWRPDGKEIVFLSADNTTLMAAAVDGHGPVFVAADERALFKARWRPGARYVYDLARDGRILGAILREPPVATPLSLIVNWQADIAQ